MTKKKNNKSFAARAKELISKYSRASFDKTEEAELNQKLAELAEEQEAYKKANGIGEYSIESYGINMNHDGVSPGSSSYLTSNYNTGYGDYTNPLGLNTTQEYEVPPSSIPTYTMDSSVSDMGVTNYPNAVGNPQSEYSPYRTSIVPSIASGAATVLGNLYLANQAGKNYDKINLPRVSPFLANLSNERSIALRNAIAARANAIKNVKSAARSRGEMLSNLSATDTAIQKNLADIYSGINSREFAANQAEKARAQSTNAELASREAQYNTAAKTQAQKERLAYQAAAMQSLPQTMKDIRQSQQQDALINSLGDDYGIYMEDYAGRKWYQPKNVVRKYRG